MWGRQYLKDGASLNGDLFTIRSEGKALDALQPFLQQRRRKLFRIISEELVVVVT